MTRIDRGYGLLLMTRPHLEEVFAFDDHDISCFHYNDFMIMI